MASKTGILLVNLGTPNSYQPKDVYRYLIEFLSDNRVIDFSWLRRQLLVRGLIVPFRYRQSAHLYKSLWTKNGSPLLVHGYEVEKKLQALMGDSFYIKLAMRYPNSSIDQGLEQLLSAGVSELIIFPMFPQYASATTGSVYQKVMEYMKDRLVIPKMTFINSYPIHPGFIGPIAAIGKTYQPEKYDHAIFSFHGLPERQIRKCLDEMNQDEQFCYKAQCYATAQAITQELNLAKDHYSVSFQSRLGRDPWIQPYTTDVLKECVQQNKKKVLVFCPSFVCDCLETTCEIGMEYQHEFKEMGGTELQLVEGLNSHPLWIEGLRQIILSHSRPLL